MKQILDNEASEASKKKIQKRCKLQLVPPDTHHHNAAERAMQTFKNHFVGILFGIDQNFPIHLWDRLILQAVLTLNLLQQSQMALTITLYANLYGAFDYNAIPLASMRCAENHGQSIPSADSIWAHHWIITSVIRCL